MFGALLRLQREAVGFFPPWVWHGQHSRLPLLYPLVTLTTHDSLSALGQMPFQVGKQSGGGVREGREDRHQYVLF